METLQTAGFQASLPDGLQPTQFASSIKQFTLSSGDWYPNDPMTYTHNLNNGEGGPQFVTRLKTDPATDKKIRQWLMTTITNHGELGGDWLHSGSYGDYNGFDHQCSSYVCAALAAGGLKAFGVLHTVGNIVTGVVAPNDLSDYARISGGKIIYPAIGNPKRD